MDLNGPGTSLFQGNDLNNFDNLESREEEEEALEEQRRRELELKNELENAFDDVSFDNDEESVFNGSGNRSGSGHSTSRNSFPHEVESNIFKGINVGLNDVGHNLTSHHIESFNTPLKQTMKNNSVKRVDFNEFENYSDHARKKTQNGSLHDIVDQSGGGNGDILGLDCNHYFQLNPTGEVVCNGLLNNSNNTNLQNYTDHAEDSSEQLKILYDVRVREVHKLTELIDSMRNEHQLEIQDLKHQLGLMMAEKERANISHSQLQSLLVECKQQVEQLVKDVNTLEKTNKELESSKRELMLEFDTARITIDDLQRKIIVLEKGSRSKAEIEQYELNLKALMEKHNMELLNLKKELDHYIRSYEALVKENEDLKLKIINLGQINDENLAKKSEIISRLSQQIEDTQRQCENLMRLSTTEDNFRLQAELKLLKEEKLQLGLKIETLEKANSRQEEEIKQYESLNKISFLNSNCDLKEFDGSEMSGKLGSELYRALNGQKAKRLEIKNLQTELDEKNKQILLMIETEKSLNREVGKLKDELKKWKSTVQEKESLILQKDEDTTKLQTEVEELKKELKTTNDVEKCEQLEKANELLKNQLTLLEKEKEEIIGSYNEEYLRFHNDGLERVREETEKHFQLEILKKDLEIENLKKEVEEVKNLYVEVYNSKENLLSQIEKEKSSSGRSSSVDVEEVKRLQKELEKSRHRILELDQTVKQQYEQEVEILNLDINQLKLQIEKIKKEKDREVAEKDKILVENELLKTEIEQVTSEKNLLFLDYEKLMSELSDLRKSLHEIKEASGVDVKKLEEKHSQELQNVINKYEITVKKLKKEIDLTLTKVVKCESKYTSPMKSQRSCLVDKSTSPITKTVKSKSVADACMLTDPEPVKIPKREVVDIMEKLGAHHEEEIKSLEKKYRSELLKLDRKFEVELEKAKEIIHRQLEKEHRLEMERLEEKHRLEMETRIEQEKKEAVMDLITEWACEVQSLKLSYAESQTEMEKMKMKYKAAKSVALQYKTYFKNKAEHMKEEWKRVEEGYERALKELEKNVHILVDVREDEVKAKVDSITKLYEQKITKMKEKLTQCEVRLAEKDAELKNPESLKSPEKPDFRKELEKLAIPAGSLCQKFHIPKSKSVGFGRDNGDEVEPLCLDSGRNRMKVQKKKAQKLESEKGRTNR